MIKEIKFIRIVTAMAFMLGVFRGRSIKNNDPNDTTLGCGRLSTRDAGMLAGLLSEFWITEEEFRDAHIRKMVIADFSYSKLVRRK
jgi:hypothetical protein